MVDASGSDDVGGFNKSAENSFDASKLWFEWIELGDTSTSTLSEAGFHISNGDLGPGQTVYTAGGFDAVNTPLAFGQLGDEGSDFGVRVSPNVSRATNSRRGGRAAKALA